MFFVVINWDFHFKVCPWNMFHFVYRVISVVDRSPLGRIGMYTQTEIWLSYYGICERRRKIFVGFIGNYNMSALEYGTRFSTEFNIHRQIDKRKALKAFKIICLLRKWVGWWFFIRVAWRRNLLHFGCKQNNIA